MKLQTGEISMYRDWLNFAGDRGIMECDFFEYREEPVKELIGDFSAGRLVAFGEHASGSLICFYSKDSFPAVDNVPIAWLDSEGSPCIVASKNLKEFLSIIPYGMGFIYSVAAEIENNLNDPELLEKIYQKIGKNSDILLKEAQNRFQDIQELIDWLNSRNILLEKDPISLIVNAHIVNNDLTKWIADNLI